MRLFGEICSYSAIIPAILAIIFFRRAPSKFFNVLIILALINDFILNEAFNGQDNWIAIYSFLLVELICMGYTLANLMPTKEMMKIFRIIVSVILIAEVVLYFVDRKLEMFYIQNSSLIIIGGIYLYQFLKYNEGTVWNKSRFWIGVTIFFNYFVNTLVLVLLAPMVNDKDMDANLAYILLTGIINVITYTLYSVALVLK